ncbi:MAG TPA: hypothetical protein DEG28_02240 [Porphyromonadaceae bacterium]|nr:hypothetical protein [Porphyromonadaceae bacterium]HBK30003.1 hypothetical protein [Porphyromonadaceae bacterium]HBX44695.1 hypothetical protein [Porphyromonadaceae bacterium]
MPDAKVIITLHIYARKKKFCSFSASYEHIKTDRRPPPPYTDKAVPGSDDFSGRALALRFFVHNTFVDSPFAPGIIQFMPHCSN